jgi:Protein of unknown function (DUF669)
MTFQYDPEMASSAWPAGSYEATITKTEESLSKKFSDPMLIVSYKIYGGPAGPTKGKVREDLKDYITAPPREAERTGSLFKLKAIAQALGAYEKFKGKTLKPKNDLVGKNLIVNLTVEESAQFGDQNRIESYGKLDRQPVAAGAEDDDVPF